MGLTQEGTADSTFSRPAYTSLGGGTMAANKESGAGQRLVLLNQEQLELNGVARVESFNPEEILLETGHGLLCIKGEGLDMKNLNLEQGLVEIVGLVTEIRYSGEKDFSKRSFLKKLFR